MWLFIHIMKTGGTSFRRFIENNQPEIVYPDREQLMNAPRKGWYLETRDFVDRMNSIDPGKDGKRIFFGHYHASVAALLNHPFRLATVLREPVARSISMIKHRRRSTPNEYGHFTGIQMLQQKRFVSRQIRNYQTKVLGHVAGLDDHVNHAIEDEGRLLEQATRTIEHMDFVGVTEDMSKTVDIWTAIEPSFRDAAFPHANRSAPVKNETEFGDEFMNVLLPQIALDIKLYEIAVKRMEDLYKASARP